MYIGSFDTKLYALAPKNGALKWTFATKSFISSSPAVGANGFVYVGSYDAVVYAVGAQTGNEEWTFTTGGGIESSPAIGGDGTVYIGSDDKNLYALDGTLGFVKWQYTFGDVSLSPAIGPNGNIYCGSADSYMYALTPTGTLVWKFHITAPIFIWRVSAPAVDSSNIVYIASGYLYAVNGATGELRFDYQAGGLMSSTPAIGADGSVYVRSDDGVLAALRNP